MNILHRLSSLVNQLDKQGEEVKADKVASILQVLSALDEEDLTKIFSEEEEEQPAEAINLPDNEGAVSPTSVVPTGPPTYSKIVHTLTKVATELDVKEAYDEADRIDAVLSDLSQRVGLVAQVLEVSKRVKDNKVKAELKGLIKKIYE